MHENINISEYKRKLKMFAEERSWEQFHNPKNLSMALSVEASELLEIFQWLTFEQASQIKNIENGNGLKKAVSEELADIILYSFRLASVLDINLEESLDLKFKQNQEKYPPEKCRGSAKKYTVYQD